MNTVAGASAPSALYSCGYCPSGAHSADMSRIELIKHLALQHNIIVVTRNTNILATRG